MDSISFGTDREPRRRLPSRRWPGWRGLHGRRGGRAWLVILAAALVSVAVAVAGLVLVTTRGALLRPAQAFHLVPGGPSLGLATAFTLTGPLGVAVDPLGDIYLTDASEVYRVDRSTRQIEVVAGTGGVDSPGLDRGDGGPAIKAGLVEPFAVAVARNGDLYIADGGNRVRRVSASTGIITTVAGDGRPGFSGDGGLATRAELNFNGDPLNTSSIALAPDGDLYIADARNNRIRKVSAATGIITTVAGDGRPGFSGDGGPALRAALDGPAGIALDDRGDIFVSSGPRIREIAASTGAIQTVFGPVVPDGLGPEDLAIGPGGVLYASTFGGARVLSVNLATRAISGVAGTGRQTFQRRGEYAGDGGPAGQATFWMAAGIATDAEGNIYVADFGNNSIRMISSTTQVINAVAGHIPQSPAHCC